MHLDQALDEFGQALRGQTPPADWPVAEAALGALSEYLLAHCGFGAVDEVSSGDLLEFLFDYYPALEAPDPDVAEALRAVCHGLAVWLHQRGERSLTSFAALGERLAADLRRTTEAWATLREQVDRSRLEGSVPAGLDGGNGLGELTSGLDRVTAGDEVDYERAEEEWYTIEELGADWAVLGSRERETLGEGPAGPVRLPSGAAERLRVGDTLHLEIAPCPAGWEVLEVFGVRPGGYE